MSKTEDKFKSVEEGTVYYMDVDLYKTSQFDSTISPHDGKLAKIYDNAADRNVLDDKDGNPLPTNTRHNAAKTFSSEKATEEKPWFGLEQEYFILDPETNFIEPKELQITQFFPSQMGDNDYFERCQDCFPQTTYACPSPTPTETPTHRIRTKN